MVSLQETACGDLMLRIFLPVRRTKPKKLHVANKLNLVTGDSFAPGFSYPHVNPVFEGQVVV